MIREALTDADLEAWVAVKNAVVPNEPATVEQVRGGASATRTLLLAEEADAAVGCAIVAQSNFGSGSAQPKPAASSNSSAKREA